MAALGTSGASLALGVYNTSQIQILKNAIESLESGSNAPSVLTLPVVETTPVVTQAKQITQESFVPASSEDIAQIQRRLVNLENFSNEVSQESSSTSTNSSSGLSNLQSSIIELQQFSNTTDIRSTTNERDLILLSDEVGRLNTFASEELVEVRDLVNSNRDSASINTSNIELIDTRVSDLDASNNDVNGRVDNLITFTGDLDSNITAMGVSVNQNSGSIKGVTSDLTNLALNVDGLGDLIDLVGGNEQETRQNLGALTESFNTLGSKAFVAGGVLKAVDLDATNCKLSFPQNDGAKYGMKFATGENKDWAMYASDPTGNTPNGTKPEKHGDVTGMAIRMKVGSSSSSGFIIENKDNKGVFSVNAEGTTRIGTAKIFDFGGNSANFGYHSFPYSFLSHNDGRSIINSSNQKNIEFRVNQSIKGIFDKNGQFVIHNDPSSHSTHFNASDGRNYIRSLNGTKFRTAKNSKDIVVIDNSGLTVNGKNVETLLTSLQNQIDTLKSASTHVQNNYVQQKSTVYLKNHNNGKYLTKASSNNDGIVDGNRPDQRTRWTIEN